MKSHQCQSISHLKVVQHCKKGSFSFSWEHLRKDTVMWWSCFWQRFLLCRIIYPIFSCVAEYVIYRRSPGRQKSLIFFAVNFLGKVCFPQIVIMTSYSRGYFTTNVGSRGNRLRKMSAAGIEDSSMWEAGIFLLSVKPYFYFKNARQNGEVFYKIYKILGTFCPATKILCHSLTTNCVLSPARPKVHFRSSF